MRELGSPRVGVRHERNSMEVRVPVLRRNRSKARRLSRIRPSNRTHFPTIITSGWISAKSGFPADPGYSRTEFRRVYMQAATQALIAEALIRSFPQRISGTPIDRELPCVWFCNLCHRFARLEQLGNRAVEQLRRPVSFRATVLGGITGSTLMRQSAQATRGMR